MWRVLVNMSLTFGDGEIMRNQPLLPSHEDVKTKVCSVFRQLIKSKYSSSHTPFDSSKFPAIIVQA